ASGLDASIGLYRQIKDDERAKSMAVLSQLGAESIAMQKYGTLSQGEMQKVLIARALVAEPRLLILDEPCIGLDPAARQRFLKDLQKLAGPKHSPTLILVTHHIEEIGDWINNVMLLKDGAVQAQGDPQNVITSEQMTQLFDCDCHVSFKNDRFRLQMGA
ncbi:MAG: ATP-binding cassette domain-containing protein, partial [Planctomycetota bacterium]